MSFWVTNERVTVETEWWKTAVIYQIYPRSFQDSNGDGVGDLNGIRRRLPYLAALGVDAVWVSPFYPSPMADFGYDVADYCDVDPRFGTLADCKSLIAEAHALGLKVILDFVPNHTSVHREPIGPAEPETRLVHLERCKAGRGTSQQLDEPFRRQRLGMG
jgi:1,4-alpha-glucan branching enzyme